MTAKIVYALLIDRMTLSQKNGWADEDGHSFIIYPVEQIAEDIDRGLSSIKSALTELSAKGLIERRRTGFSAPNRIYVLLPDGREPDILTVGKEAGETAENGQSKGRRSGGMMGGTPAPNQQRKNDPNRIQRKEAMPRAAFGRYKNVFLGLAEYALLKSEYPNTDWMIEQLSVYMKSEGRTYADHGATLRLWLERNEGKRTAAFPDYIRKEGESL